MGSFGDRKGRDESFSILFLPFLELLGMRVFLDLPAASVRDLLVGSDTTLLFTSPVSA